LEKANNPLFDGWSITPVTSIDKWRCVHVHKLELDENQGSHNVYVDVIDESGQRIAHPSVTVSFGWTGSTTQTTIFEKPEWEPGANFMLTAGEYAWCAIGNDSDIVNGLFGEAGHTSYYIVFQRQNSDVVTEPHQPNTVIVPMDVILDIRMKLKALQDAVAIL
jgi:roadblock/LC7 domain-containing protein